MKQNKADFAQAPDRSILDFETKARQAFTFLRDMGYVEIEALPTLIRFRKGALEVDVYHGRSSFEISAGITRHGTRYSLGELMRATDPNSVKGFYYPAMVTPSGVATGVELISSLLKRYGGPALEGDPQFFSTLEIQRVRRREELALDVLEYQLRPKAEEAFRNKDYAKAAELYGQIREQLSPAEVKKLEFAEKRRQS